MSIIRAMGRMPISGPVKWQRAVVTGRSAAMHRATSWPRITRLRGRPIDAAWGWAVNEVTAVFHITCNTRDSKSNARTGLWGLQMLLDAQWTWASAVKSQYWSVDANEYWKLLLIITINRVIDQKKTSRTSRRRIKCKQKGTTGGMSPSKLTC